MHALHQQVGDPVGSGCGIEIYTNMVLFTDESLEVLNTFLSYLVEQSELTESGTFQCFSWHVRHSYWRSRCTCRARPIKSVILPTHTVSKLMTDVTNFLEEDTRNFYQTHGIPYRRSYLFYGVPGTGKTSLIQAMAGHFKRSVSYLQPTDPDITDDSLREAINQLPENTIVVFEDIDSLFAADRSNKVSKSSLTFSGLLNALDGVGSANGQIFILTTNLREQLDSALIRNGRVDLHIEFTYATSEQISAMWSSFYPDEAHRGDEFAAAVLDLLGERQVAAAGLQHYFVMNMKSTPEEAMANIQWIVDDLNEKAAEEDKTKSAAAAKAGADDGKPGSAASDSSAAGATAAHRAGKHHRRHRGGGNKAATAVRAE